MAYGLAEPEITREGASRLTLRVTGIGADDAGNLLGATAQLEFRKPILSASHNVICETVEGDTYAAPYSPFQFAEDREANRLSCPAGSGGLMGFVQWEPATATDSQGGEQVLSGAFLRPNAQVADDPVNVVIEFTDEGSLLLEQITTELVALPIAIWIDEDLVGAPTVSEPITGGATAISGLSEGEAHILAAQLNSGPLPVPVEIVSTEEQP